jgi:hypothetical protein
MSALQGKVYETVVRLEVDSGYGITPVLGVLPTEADAAIRRTGTYSFQLKALDVDSWIELGGGYYVIVWKPADTAALGEVYYTLESNGVVFNRLEGKFSVEPLPLSAISSPAKCIVSGNILDLGGEPSTESWLNFRVAKTPSVLGGSLVEGKILRTIPDAYGNFSVVLLRGKKVIVEIPQAGLRHTISVPEQETANLVDLLPPIND